MLLSQFSVLRRSASQMSSANRALSSSVQNIVNNYRDFVKNDLDKKEYEPLEHGQSPEILYIGCSDSRVIPAVFTKTGPNQIFVTRNVGGFIPKYDASNGSASNMNDWSVFSSVEYAMAALPVKDIVFMAHSKCGACKTIWGLHKSDNKEPDLSGAPALMSWLTDVGGAVKDAAKEVITDSNTEAETELIVEQKNVEVQLANLLSHPGVRDRVKQGSLNLHGWHYSVHDAKIDVFNPETKEFASLEDLDEVPCVHKDNVDALI